MKLCATFSALNQLYIFLTLNIQTQGFITAMVIMNWEKMF